MPYENQLDIMTKTKQVFNNLLEIDLDVFATENFSYDINTLKLAQELDINYLLKRGTTEEDSTIYNLTDFDVKLISLSNVKDSHLNSTPISDHDLHIRGADIVE